MQQYNLKFLNIHLKFIPIFLFSKKYLTQKNVVEKVSTNLSQGKVRFYILIIIFHQFIELPSFDLIQV